MVLVWSGYCHFFKYISGYREIIRIQWIRIRHTARNHTVSVMPGVLMNLCCLMSYWSSASWCPAAPLLPDVLLILCCLVSCSVLLPDVLQIHCCIMSCCFSADWCPADPLLHDILLLLRWLVPCRFTAAWCPAASLLTGVLQIRPTAPLLTGVLQIHCCMMSTCSSADWCPADQLLHDVICYSARILLFFSLKAVALSTRHRSLNSNPVP